MSNINKPNFFIVGAAKSGTTSIYNILENHPEIFMCPIKEPHHFSKDIKISNFNDSYKKRNIFDIDEYLSSENLEHKHIAYINDFSKYIQLFRNVTNQKIIGEVSNGYLYSELAAREIFKFNPTAKIIIILREPVDRCFSHWLMDYRIGLSRSNSCIDDIMYDYNLNDKIWGGLSHTYIQIGLYYDQVKRYVDIFPKENLKILFFKDLKNNPNKFEKEILNFLNLESSKNEKKIEKKFNQARVPKYRFSSLVYNYFISRPHLKKVIHPSLAKKFKNLLFTPNFEKKNYLTSSDKNEIQKFFIEDINNLENLLEVNLSDWKKL
tara:strand:- start:7992 stop:8957 length:966 start_codon:yes stop_codon:yes gene_type:complete